MTHLIQSILLIFSTLAAIATAASDPQMSLPHLFKSSIAIDKMYSGQNSPTSSFYTYIYNYPTEILTMKKRNILLYVHSMEWDSNSQMNQLIYHFRHIPRETAVLIYLTSSYLSWKQFNIGILLSGPEIIDDLYISQLQIKSFSQKVKQKLPTKVEYEKTVTFIVGFDLICSSAEKSQFLVDVASQLINPNQIQFSITIGSSNQLKNLLISYIAYSNTSNNLKKSGQFILTSFLGISYNGLRSDLPITQYYIFGFSGIKYLPNQDNFKITFDIIEQYVFEITSVQPIDYLKATFFGISKNPSDTCSQGKNSVIFSSGWQNKCVKICDSDTWKKEYEDGGKACVKCPKELNMTLDGDTCNCALGFMVFEGKCMSFMDMGTTGTTFSLSASDCAGPNMVMNAFGQCDCKVGFERNNEGICKKKCENGFWNGFGCTQCQKGQYGRQDYKKCISCVTGCDDCQNQNKCEKCKNGYQLTADKTCEEICGDGTKFEHQCDDANQMNGDGCSSDCKIEEGFSCTGGSSSFPDFCTFQQFAIKQIIQEVKADNLILNCFIEPAPKDKFPQEYLDRIVKVSVFDGQNDPCRIYTTQVLPGKLKIILNYENQLPIFDFDLELELEFSPYNVVSRQMTSQLYNRNVRTNSVFDQRGLI